MLTTVKCIECGSKCCVCEDQGLWAAHCMYCDNSIGKRGFYDPCAKTEQDAVEQWNKLNHRY